MANGMIRELRTMSEEDLPAKATRRLTLAALADILENQERLEERVSILEKSEKLIKIAVGTIGAGFTAFVVWIKS